MGRQENATSWSTEEKRELLDLHSRHPSQWLVLSELMKRTPASVRNCFQRINPTRERTCRNLCKRCGRYSRGHVCSKPYKTVVRLNLRGINRSNPYDAVNVKLRESDAECVPIFFDLVTECTRFANPGLFSLYEMEQEWALYGK